MRKYYTDVASTIIALLVIAAWALFLTIVVIDIVYVYAMG